MHLAPAIVYVQLVTLATRLMSVLHHAASVQLASMLAALDCVTSAMQASIVLLGQLAVWTALRVNTLVRGLHSVLHVMLVSIKI